MGQILDVALPLVTAGFPYPPKPVRWTDTNGNHTAEGPTINGIGMPGQWLLTTAKRQFGWQEQKAAFQGRPALVPVGDPLVHVEYEVRIWEEGTYGDFLLLCQTILKKGVVSLSGGVPISTAIAIDDPILKMIGITKVCVDFVDPPKNPLVSSGGKGPWVGKVGFIEWGPRIIAPPVPEQSYPDPGPLVPPASQNLATATASVTSGALALQGKAARSLVPPP